MDPYKKTKKGGRLSGGDPSKVVIGEAAGTQGQQVQASGNQAQISSRGTTVQKGASSSYNTSSGMMNWLDAAQGASQVINGSAKLAHSIDDYKLTQMEKDVTELTSSDAWTNVESPDYIGDDKKNETLDAIYEKHGDTFMTDRGRNKWNSTVASNDMNHKEYTFEEKKAELNALEARLTAQGEDESVIAAQMETGYSELEAQYSKDPLKKAAIEQARYSKAANFSATVAQSASVAASGWEQSGGVKRIVKDMPTNMGYESFRKAALADIAEMNGGNSLGQAVWSAYDPSTGEFTGPYADMIGKNVDKQLEGHYSAAVAMQMQQEDDTAAVVSSGVWGRVATESVNSSSEFSSMRLADGIGSVIRMNQGMNTPTSPGQNIATLSSGMSQYGAQVFKANPNINQQQFNDMIDKTIDEQAEDIAAFVDAESPEQLAEILGQLKAEAKGSMRMASDTRRDNGKKQANSAVDTVQASATNNPHDAKRKLAANPVATSISSNKPFTFYTSTVNGEPMPAGELRGLADLGRRTIWSSAVMNGHGAQGIQDLTKDWAEAVEKFQDGTISEQALMTRLQDLNGGEEKSSFTFQEGARGEWSSSFKHAGDQSKQQRAALGQILPMLKFSDKGIYEPSTASSETVLRGTLKSMIRSDLATQSSVTEETSEDIFSVITTSTAVFGPQQGSAFAVNVLLDSLTDEAFSNDDLRSSGQAALHAAIRTMDPKDPESVAAVAVVLDDIMNRRWSAVESKTDSTTGQVVPSNLTPGAATIAGVLTVSNSGGTRPSSTRDNWGDSMFGTVKGVNDDDAATGFQNLTPSALDATVKAGVDAGVFSIVDGAIVPMVDLEEENAAQDAADRIQKHLIDSGTALQTEYDKDGEPVRVTTRNRERVWSMGAGGELVPGGYESRDFEGSFYDSMVTSFPSIDETASEIGPVTSTASAVGEYVSAKVRGLVQGNTLDVFEEHVRSAGVSTGRSDESVEKFMASPGNRRNLAGWSRSARELWTSGPSASMDRRVLSNQITAQLEALNSAYIDVDPEVIPDIKLFQERLKKGEMVEGGPVWERTVELAKNSGYSTTNPPMFFVQAALLSMMTGQSSVENLSPFDFVDDGAHIYRETGPGDPKSSGFSHSRFNIDNMHILGDRNPTNVDLPIMAAPSIEGGLLSDTRTMVRPLQAASYRSPEARAAESLIKEQRRAAAQKRAKEDARRKAEALQTSSSGRATRRR